MPSSCRVSVLDVERRQFARPQCGGKADQDQGSITQPGQGVGDRLEGGAQRFEHQCGLFAQRPAMGAADTGKGCRDQWRGGRRRIAGEQVQVAHRGMAQTQGIDREPPARLGREKCGDGFGRGRQCGLAMHGAPFGEGRHSGTVGPPCIDGPGGAPVIGGGCFGLGETQRRRRQLDNGFELEPVAHRIRVRAGRQARRERGGSTRQQSRRIASSRPIRRPRSSDHCPSPPRYEARFVTG